MISCTSKKSHLHYTDFPAKIKGILHVFLHDFLFSPSCISVAQCLCHAVENAYRAFGSCKFFPPGWPHTRRPSKKLPFHPKAVRQPMHCTIISSVKQAILPCWCPFPSARTTAPGTADLARTYGRDAPWQAYPWRQSAAPGGHAPCPARSGSLPGFPGAPPGQPPSFPPGPGGWH